MRAEHLKTLAKIDGVDATRVQPSDWNAGHKLQPWAAYVAKEDEFLNGIAATGSIGELGWVKTNNAADAAAPIAGLAKHPGILSLVTGGANGNNVRMHLGSAANVAVLIPTEMDRFRWVVRIPTITTMSVRLGLGADISAASFGNDGAFFEYDVAVNANWRTRTRNAGGDTSNNSAIAVVAGNWYDLEARRLAGGNWEFYINSVLRFTHAAQLPAVALNVGALAQTGAAAARTLDVDYFGFSMADLGNRYS